MLSSSPPPIDDGGHDDWGDDGFGGFQDASSNKDDFGDFTTFNSVQEDLDEPPTAGRPSGVKETLPDNDRKVNGNISERFICDQDSHIPPALEADIPPRGHNRVASDEGFADFQSIPKPKSDSKNSPSQNGDSSRHADSDGNSNPTQPSCDNSTVSQPAGTTCEAQTVDNTSQDSVADSGLCSDMSPGAKCEDYLEFPNQKDPSHIFSPQGSTDCAHTESTLDSSISADKKSSDDNLPSESRSTSESLTCSGESDSVVKEDTKELSTSNSDIGTCEPMEPVSSNINHDCSTEGNVNCENVSATEANRDGSSKDMGQDKHSQQSNSANLDTLQDVSENEGHLETDCQPKQDNKENRDDIPSQDSKTIAAPESQDSVDSEQESATPECSDRDSIQTTESEDKGSEEGKKDGKAIENNDSPEDEFGTFGSFRNSSDLQFRQSVSEDFDDFQEAEDVDGFGTTPSAKGEDHDDDDGNELTFRAATGKTFFSCVKKKFDILRRITHLKVCSFTFIHSASKILK